MYHWRDNFYERSDAIPATKVREAAELPADGDDVCDEIPYFKSLLTFCICPYRITILEECHQCNYFVRSKV